MPARKIDNWLDISGRNQHHPGNQRLHDACVPAIGISLGGLRD